MFDFCGYGDDSAGSHWDRSLAPFLIPAATSNANQHLYLLVVDVPVVTAARLEGDIYHTTTNISQIALAYEVLAVRIRIALGPFGVRV